MRMIDKETGIDEALREALKVYGNRGSIRDIEDVIRENLGNGYRIKMAPEYLNVEDTCRGIKKCYPVIDSTEKLTLGNPKTIKFSYVPKNKNN